MIRSVWHIWTSAVYRLHLKLVMLEVKSYTDEIKPVRINSSIETEILSIQLSNSQQESG